MCKECRTIAEEFDKHGIPMAGCGKHQVNSTCAVSHYGLNPRDYDVEELKQEVK